MPIIQRIERSIIIPVTLISETCLTIQLPINNRECVRDLQRRLGVEYPSQLYCWPAGIPLRENENIYDLVTRNNVRLYVRSPDPLALIHEQPSPARQGGGGEEPR